MKVWMIVYLMITLGLFAQGGERAKVEVIERNLPTPTKEVKRLSNGLWQYKVFINPTKPCKGFFVVQSKKKKLNLNDLSSKNSPEFNIVYIEEEGDCK